jgi:hypothetical protein
VGAILLAGVGVATASVAASIGAGRGSSNGDGDGDDPRRPSHGRVPPPIVAPHGKDWKQCVECRFKWPMMFLRPHPDTVAHPNSLVCVSHLQGLTSTLQANPAQHAAGCNAVPAPLLGPSVMQAVAANRANRAKLVHKIVAIPCGQGKIKYHCGVRPGVVLGGGTGKRSKVRVIVSRMVWCLYTLWGCRICIVNH